MSDLFQSIVDEKATEAEAQALGTHVLEWLVAKEIVQSTASDCVLGSDQGYSPGSNYLQATDMGLPGIGGEVASFQNLLINGLEIITERTVFHPGQSELCLVCDRCGKRQTDDDIGESWGNALDEWSTASGEGLMICPGCGGVRPVTEWTYDPPWGFGCLGFTFWNWPMLSPAFVKEIEHILGHPVKLVAGKL